MVSEEELDKFWNGLSEDDKAMVISCAVSGLSYSYPMSDNESRLYDLLYNFSFERS